MSIPFVQRLRDSAHSLGVAGISARWSAVQQHLHPLLTELAERVHQAAAQQFPQSWPLYEISYKSQRYINRGHGKRAPIDEYHVAFDRPPRGSGLLVSVSGAEQAILVGVQLWGVRKNDLHRLWSTGRLIWQPLVERIEHHGQARFRQTTARSSTTKTDELSWLDHYLDTRQANYLWAGFVYPWRALPDALDTRLIDHVLELFPLNEALMEQAESHEPYRAAHISEQRAVFAVSSVLPSIETIVERVRSQPFAISETLVRSYHIALQTRPLVILPGISGTGKTRLTRLYADAVHNIPSPAHKNPYYLIIAVQPDWHNARDLLGYYNAITERYHPTPLLRFLMQATAHPQQQYFLCLDEMNLARPEYYLAPLLSALETSDRTIDLGTPTNTVRFASDEMLRNPFRLPLNVRITGTVNVDESTHPLSDKLLDRANVIELTDVDLEAFRQVYQGTIDEQVWQTIVNVYGIVEQAGHPFGYRTISEILDYIEQSRSILPLNQALDLQIKQKILPKLRGEESQTFCDALGQLRSLLEHTSLPESAEKVRHMLARLTSEGFTDFYQT